MKSKIKKIKFIDLFDGLGGIRLGFEQAFNENGFKTVSFLFQNRFKNGIKVDVARNVCP